jgi:hypothetical protein
MSAAFGQEEALTHATGGCTVYSRGSVSMSGSTLASGKQSIMGGTLGGVPALTTIPRNWVAGLWGLQMKTSWYIWKAC